MRVFSLAFVVIWACLTVFSLAAPLDTPLVVRTEFSQESSSAVAETTLDGRAQTGTRVGPQGPVSTTLRSATGQTWVVAELITPIATAYVISMLRQARAALRLRISQVGDGVIAGGVFMWQGFGGHSLRMENSNNHQQTMGVVAAALGTLMDFLITQSDHGVQMFIVGDGPNEVGVGVIVSTATPLLAMQYLDKRSQFCHNAPTIVAGLPFNRRTGTGPVVWCVRYSRTYVVIQMGRMIAAASIEKMLDEAFYLVTDLIHSHGDGPLRNGQFFSSIEQTGVHVWNENNHQTTLGVLAGALNAVSEYMSLTAFGEATFTIHDGGNLVGEGSVGLVQNQ